MGDRQPQDNGAGDERWIPRFDPVVGVQALGEVQRRGLRAAGELVERLIGAVDGDADPADQDSAQGSGSGPQAEPGPGSGPGWGPAGLVGAWMELVQRSVQALAAMTGPDGRPAGPGQPAPTADLGRGTTTGAVHVRTSTRPRGDPDPPAEVWLHNGTTGTFTGLRLHSGELRAHDGATVPGAAVRFDPPALPELPARSSRGVTVTVDTATSGDGLAAGVYRGVLLVAGAPDVWLPIVLTMTDGEAGDETDGTTDGEATGETSDETDGEATGG